MRRADKDFGNSLKIATAEPDIGGFFRSFRIPEYTNEPLEDEPEWDTSFVVTSQPECPSIVRLTDLGYSKDEILAHNGIVNDLALCGPLRLLSDEGARCLASIGGKLRRFAVENGHVISTSTRGCERRSKFLYNMVRDKNFLLTASRIAGVPLIPHPLKDPAIMVNYYSAVPTKETHNESVGKWHYDSMDYVFTILLTDASEYEGGQFIYYHGRKNRFGCDPARSDKLVPVDFRKCGDTVHSLGSMMYHCVTPVTRGHRSTMVISLFCPYFANKDSNRFWQLTPDDGLLRVTLDWFRYKNPVRKPEYYFDYVNSPVITWDML